MTAEQKVHTVLPVRSLQVTVQEGCAGGLILINSTLVADQRIQ